jgi:hypothetical protein
MAGIKAPWWQWYPTDYLAAVSNLDLDVQGAWMRIICHAMNNGENPGYVSGNMTWIATDLRKSIGDAWGVLVTLALLKICDLVVDRGTGFKVVNEAWISTLAADEKPGMFWRFEVRCRRVERDALRREKTLNRKIGICEDGQSSNQNGGKMVDHPIKSAGRWPILLARKEAEAEAEADNTHSPLPPLTLDASEKKPAGRKRKTAERVAENTELMCRIGSWFGRKPTTPWAVEEAQKLERLNPQPDEIETLATYYASEHPEIKPYRRQNLETLLNNWLGDLDKARTKLERFPGDGLPPTAGGHGADITRI